MKKYLLLFLLISSFGFAQNLNDYQYAQVPAKFSFLKEDNKYNMNLLCKMFMQKYGFETYYDNEVSNEEFAKTNCNKVYLDVLENSTMFSTKLKIVLKDCKGTILATSGEGTSRAKEYNVAYNEAIRMCFDNFNVVKTHKYHSVEKSEIVTDKVDFQTDKINDQKIKIQSNGIELEETELVVSNQLIAETVTNGFLIIDSKTSTVVLNLLKTSDKNIFIAFSNKIKGVVIKKGNEIFIEYYNNNILVSEKLNLCCL